MTDLVQWLDIFVAFMCSNCKYVHVTVELNLGMQIEISYVCITFRKKIKSNWFLLGSCPSYFESGSSSWNNMHMYTYTFYYIMYNLTFRTRISSWDCWQVVVDSVWTVLSDSPSVVKSLRGGLFCASEPLMLLPPPSPDLFCSRTLLVQCSVREHLPGGLETEPLPVCASSASDGAVLQFFSPGTPRVCHMHTRSPEGPSSAF